MSLLDDIRFSLIDSILHCVSTPTPNPRYEIWNISDAYNPIAGDSYIENLGMNYSVTANQTLSVINYHDSLLRPLRSVPICSWVERGRLSCPHGLGVQCIHLGTHLLLGGEAD